jgi:DNA-binding transcriptional ArsR family regulator
MSRRPPAALRLEKAASLFAALGDETRLTLVSRLGTIGPMSTARLTEGGQISRQAVTKHLEVLAGAGLVRDERQGRERLWVVEAERLTEARRYLDTISSQWDGALARLRALVED